MSILARNPIPKPLADARFSFSGDGRRALGIDLAGKCWWVEVDPSTREVAVRQIPLHVPFEIQSPNLAFSNAFDRVMVRTDGLMLYDLPSGEVIADVRDVPGRVACLSPCGTQLIAVDQERGWAMDLARSVHWVETGELHRQDGEEGIYLDHVDELDVFPADGEDRYWLAAACYGFVAVHQFETGGRLDRVPGRSRNFGGLVYDPTELIRPSGRYFFVRHGFGMGLAALDPVTGERHDCQIRPPRQTPYSFIRWVARGADAACVLSGDGSFLWRPGEAPVRIPDPGVVIAVYADSILCVDGESLAWRAIG